VFYDLCLDTKYVYTEYHLSSLILNSKNITSAGCIGHYRCVCVFMCTTYAVIHVRKNRIRSDWPVASVICCDAR
jgi:hypothetical protein